MSAIRSSDDESDSSIDEERLTSLPLIPKPVPVTPPDDPVSTEPQPPKSLHDTNGNVPSGPRAHKRFSLWSDMLLEESVSKRMKTSLKAADTPPDVELDRNVENYEYWTKRQRSSTDNGSRQSSRTNEAAGAACDNKSDNNNQSHVDGKFKRKRKKNKKHKSREEYASSKIAKKLNESKIDLIRKLHKSTQLRPCTHV